jgi:rRNA maturation endonuclease Nob1
VGIGKEPWKMFSVACKQTFPPFLLHCPDCGARLEFHDSDKHQSDARPESVRRQNPTRHGFK